MPDSVTPNPRKAGGAGSPGPRAPWPPDTGTAGAGLPLARVIRAVRRHLLLSGFVASFVATGVWIALQEVPRYRATATLRLAGERRHVSAGMEEASAPIDRTSAPLLSLVPRVRSRAVVGSVVDSLKLQLRWVPLRSGMLGLSAREPEPIALDSVALDPAAGPDTLRLLFTTKTFIATGKSEADTAAYGRPVEVGGLTFTIRKPPAATAAFLAILSRDHAIDRLLSELAVVPVTGTDAIEVRFTDPSAREAQRVANLLAEVFHIRTIESSQEQARRRREFLESQLAETDELLRRARGSLAGFRRRQQVASSADKLAMQQAALVALDARRNEVEADRRVYQSLLDQVENTKDTNRSESLRILAYSPEIAADPTVSRVYQQLLLYRSRLDSLTTGPWRSAETNPDVVQLKEQLESAQEELVLALRAHLRSLEGRSSALSEIRTSSVDNLRSMPVLEAEETYLGEQVASLSALTSQLRLDYQKARMVEELEAGDVEVVDLAALPYRPVGVPGWLKMAIAAVIGLAAAVGVVLLVDTRNRSIRDPEELAEIIPARGLGIIPRVEEATGIGNGLGVLRALRSGVPAGNGLPHEVVRDSPKPSPGTEAFRLLYSSLTFGWGERQRIILVTSTAPREGKTLVATNLAVTFAREGAQVLLVDCDLRRPRVHKIFRLPRSPGLMDLLGSSTPPPASQAPVVHVDAPPAHGYSMFGGLERPENGGAAAVGSGTTPAPAPAPKVEAPAAAVESEPRWVQPSAIRRTSIRGLSVLPCGTLPENPAEAFKAGGVRRVLREFADHFDLIVIDTPPVLVSADAPILAPLADGVLLVVRAGQTEREPAERAYDQLTAAGASVVGTVLNDPGEEVGRYRTLYYSYDYPVSAD